MVHRVFSADMFGRAGESLRAKLGDIAVVMLAAPCGDVAYRRPAGGRLTRMIAKRAAPSPRRFCRPIRSKHVATAAPIVVRSVVRQIPDRPYDSGRSCLRQRPRFERRGQGTISSIATRRKKSPSARSGPTQCDVEFQAIAFGDVAIVTNPAELFSIYGVKIKQASPFKVTFVASLANGYCGYVPTPRGLRARRLRNLSNRLHQPPGQGRRRPDHARIDRAVARGASTLTSATVILSEPWRPKDLLRGDADSSPRPE